MDLEGEEGGGVEGKGYNGCTDMARMGKGRRGRPDEIGRGQSRKGNRANLGKCNGKSMERYSVTVGNHAKVNYIIRVESEKNKEKGK